ncbi:hypothetical protein C9374_001910 [Naegleria lovaniensis]|uniref:Dilute domain-containing protein n=1 Tax=Naegleria lovaniensis TaxID=51637 RepID=A0AA88KKJ8_NAELO|nr:uncharacterized protein C9374_001910 [Naegleria lovaniensis]KAG2386875.1 hypothetical protein C9374_001910 [Naegleria lovaniensis]
MTDATEDSEDDHTKRKGFRSNKFNKTADDDEYNEDDDHFGETYDDDEEFGEHNFDDEEDHYHDDDDLRSGASNQSQNRDDNEIPSSQPSKRSSVKQSRDSLDDLDDEVSARSSSNLKEDSDEDQPAKKPVMKSLAGISAAERRNALNKNNSRKHQNLSLTSEVDSDAFLKNLEKTNQTIQERQKRNEKNNGGLTVTSPRNTMSEESMTGDEHSSGDEARLAEVQKQIKQEQLEKKAMQEKLERLQREANERALIDYVIINKTPEFEKEIAVSAPILYKCLKHWDSFTPSNNQVLSKITKALQQVVQKNENNQTNQCYWLSVILSLLTLLQTDFPVSRSQEHGVQIDLLKRVESSAINAGKGVMEDVLPPKDNVVDVKEMLQIVYQVLDIDKQQKNTLIINYGDSTTNEDEFAFDSPVSQFKNELLSLVNKIFIQYYQDVIRQLLPFLFEALFGKHGQMSSTSSPMKIVKLFENFYKLFQDNYISKTFSEQFFAHLFYFINCFGFNAILSGSRRYCNMGSAIMLKMCVSQLEQWADEKKFGLGSIKSIKRGLLPIVGLVYLRQSSDVMIMNKASLVDSTTRQEVCPVLSATQLRKILESYQKDDFDPDVVPQAVLKSLPALDKNKPAKFYSILRPSLSLN